MKHGFNRPGEGCARSCENPDCEMPGYYPDGKHPEYLEGQVDKSKLVLNTSRKFKVDGK